MVSRNRDQRLSGDRAQLILLTAVLVAVTILASVILLNAIHVPADIQTGTLSEDTDKIERVDASIRNDLDRLFLEITAPTDLTGHRLPFVINEGEFRAAINDTTAIWSNVTGNRSGSLLSVAYDPGRTKTGTAVFQINDSTFESADGNQSWLLFEDATRLSLEMTVTNRSGTNATLNVTGDSGGSWELALSEDNVYTTDAGPLCNESAITNFDSSRIYVSVRGGDGRVRAATGNGTVRCGQFTFGNGVTTPWNVSFEDGDRITGTYGIAGQGALSTPTNNTTPYPGGDQPWRDQNVIVNPAFEISYLGDGVTYRSAFRLNNRTGR